MGTRTNGHHDKWAPGQMGTRTNGQRTNGHQDKSFISCTVFYCSKNRRLDLQRGKIENRCGMPIIDKYKARKTSVTAVTFYVWLNVIGRELPPTFMDLLLARAI